MTDGSTVGNETFLGKYTIDGERVRVVIGMLGTSLVSYYKITPDGLVEEKGGRVFYTKAALAAKEAAFAAKEVALLKRYIGTWTDKDSYHFVEISYTGNRIRLREAYGSTAHAGVEYFGEYSGDGIIAVGDPQDFYKYQLPTFKVLESGELLHNCGACSDDDKLKKTATKMPKVKYLPPANGD